MTRNRLNRTSRRSQRSSAKPSPPVSKSDAVALRKTMQLCRQVEQTLYLVLSGECDDPILQSLLVESVVPAPSASQLLVTVRQSAVDDPASKIEILQRLADAEGQLRWAVAGAITRKRAPRLLFDVAPAVQSMETQSQGTESGSPAVPSDDPPYP